MTRILRTVAISILLALSLGLLCPTPLTAQTTQPAQTEPLAKTQKQEAALRIVLQNNSPAEREVLTRLARLFVEYEALQRWLFTGGMVIDEGTRIPHSHPVLTMNTRIEGDVDLLSVLVHEQLHWLANEREDAVEEAVTEFREIFPEVPVGGGEGARDESSSYLHLVVCDLEFQALTELVGEERAREHLAAMTHYTWIYQQVLEDPRVREVTTRHGLLVP